jgi:large subunit ribosomal protein L5
MAKRCGRVKSVKRSLTFNAPLALPEEMMPDIKNIYEEQVVPKLKETFKYKNVMEVPKLKKIVLNIGLGEAIQNIKVLDAAAEELKMITGQKPVITRAKKSIAAFKLRAGMPIGCMVTLRRQRMYDFLQKLINIALPRVRDFRGISGKAMDGFGNYSLGIKEHIIFPEIEYDKIDKIKGLNITIVTSAKNDREGKELLKLMGMPFRN